jgi:hypothetical protein
MLGCRDSSINMANIQRAGDRAIVVPFPAGTRNFSFLGNCHTGSGAYPPSCTMDIRGCGVRLSIYLRLVPKLRKSVAIYLHSTIYFHGTHRDKYLPFEYEPTVSFLVCKWSISKKFHKHIYMCIASYARAYDLNSTNYGIHQGWPNGGSRATCGS